MSKERCHENAFCEVCRFGDFSGKCFAVESQREIVAHYGGYEQFELMSFCLDKDQRIAELEEQLKNAIVPKFKIRQEVFYINSRNKISSGVIYNVRYDSVKGFDYYIPMLQIEDFRIKEECLFATKEEAQAKLRELQGEKK